MKTAITDYTFTDLDIETEILSGAGSEVVSGQCKTPADLIALTGDCDYVITQFAPLNAAVIASLDKTKAIVRYGIGYDNVDGVAARAKEIDVCNIPDYCVQEVADHTLAFILATTRGVVPNCLQLRLGEWGLATSLERMKCLRDMTVGVVGFGRIGRAVVDRLKPFQCRIVVHDPLVDASEVSAVGAASVGFDELLASSDLVTLHCPANERTQGLINAETLAKMRGGSILVNVGRGALVNTDDLVDALKNNHLSAAALDVFDPEPLPADHALLGMGSVVVTSHIASASVRAVRTLRETAATIVAMAIRGEPLPNIVN
jgi:D-3-phosphoglycerate dehydrogenase